MLASKNRLTKREDFAKVYNQGSFLSHDGFTIKYILSQKTEPRIGFSVGKNFSKKAVERNQIKRLLRSASWAYIKSLKPGFDIVIIPKSFREKTDLKKISTILESLFKKAKLLK